MPLAALLAWLAARSIPRRPLVLLALVPAVLTFVLLAGDAGAVAAGRRALDVGAGRWWLLADLFTLPRRQRFSVERAGRAHRLAAQTAPGDADVSNHARPRRIASAVRDDVPHELRPRAGRVRPARCAGRSRTTLALRAAAQPPRGASRLRQVYLRVRSRLGLWQRLLDYPVRDARSTSIPT